MPIEFWLIWLAILVFFTYVIAKVWALVKQSERDWEKVDKSKLKEWEDDPDSWDNDDWGSR